MRTSLLSALTRTLPVVKQAVRPGRLARSVVVAAITVLAAPFLAIALLLGLGGLAGSHLGHSPSGVVAWGASVAVVIAFVAVVDLLVGVLAVAKVQTGSRIGGALAKSIATLPRLAAALVVVLFAVLVLFGLWPLVTAGCLVTTVILRLRHRPGALRALIAAIPFLPVLVAIALIPATIVASSTGNASIRDLLVSAANILRRRKRALLAFVILSAVLSALLSFAGTTIVTALDSAGHSLASLLVAAITLVALMVAVGAVLAMTLPSAAGGQGESARVRPPRTRTLSRVAVVAIMAVIASVVPIASASADPLIAPTLTMGIDDSGPSPLLSADVAVTGANPAGLVQFYDGSTPLGSPVRLGAPNSGESWAYLTDRPVLSPGDHQLTFAYQPDSSLVAPGSATPIAWHFTATSTIGITTDSEAAVGHPAQVTATVAADYTTAVKPTGTVLIQWEPSDSTDPSTGETTVSLVDGVAHFTIPNLVSAGIYAKYNGSPDFTTIERTIQVGAAVAPQDTETTASVLNAPYALGSAMDVSVQIQVPNAAGVNVTGDVQAYAGTTLLATATDIRNFATMSIPTASLHAGSVDLRFQFVPSAGFAASETTVTTTLTTARTTASATLSSSSSSWGNPLSLSVAVTSTLDSVRTIEVRDTRTNTVVTTQTVAVSAGSGTASIDLSSKLRPGGYTLVAAVLGDSDRAGAVSASSTSSVGPALTTTALTVTPAAAEIGRPVTVTAVVVSAAGLPDTLPGTVIFDLPDSTRQTVAVTAGTASFTWTPTELTGSFSSRNNITASYFDSTFLFSGSYDKKDVTVSAAVAPLLSSTWSGNRTPSDRTITLTYGSSTGHSLPTGSVRIFDAAGVMLTNGSLVDGVATIRVEGTSGAHPVLHAVYLGDSVYGSRDDILAVDTLLNYSPSVTVTAPTGTALGTAFTVGASVTGVPLGLVKTVTITDTAPNGATSTVATVTLDGSGNASTPVTLLVAGSHQISATVSFSAASELADVAAPTTPIAVAPVPVPDLVITTSTPSSDLVAGGSVNLDVTAQWIGSGTTGVDAGTTANILDSANTVVGTVTLLGATGVAGYIGHKTLTNLHGGALNLHAVVIYGPLAATASSPVLPLVVAPPTTMLDVQAASVEVGTPLVVNVTVLTLGGFAGPSRSLAASVVVSGIAYSVTLSRATATASFTGSVNVPTVHAGDLNISASTAGDAIDTGAASDTFGASVQRRTTSITTSVTPDTVTGQTLAVVATVVHSGAAVSPAATGSITVVSTTTLDRCTTGADHTCTITGFHGREGSNGFTSYYDGDADNAPATGSASITVGIRSSHLSVSYSPAIGSWVYGEPVTATWTTTTSGGAALGLVDVTIDGSSCSGTAASGSCTVTPRTLAQTGPLSAAYSATFVPFDDAPRAVVGGTTSLALCVFPTFAGNTRVDYSLALRCGDGGVGIRTGSLVTLSATPSANYAIDHWLLDFQTIAGSNPQVLIESSGAYSYVQTYAPACFTLNLGPVYADRATNGGYLTSTRPNCSDPNTATVAELAAAASGHPRYAAGTAVDVFVSRYSGGGPAIVLDTITGLTLANANYGSLLMDRTRTVAATFKLKACIALAIQPTLGGTVAVTDAVRPISSATLLPATGACVADNGASGYVPGTTLTFTATPAADASLSTWKVANDAAPFSASDVAPVAVASLAEASSSAVLTKQVVVSAAYNVVVSAIFAQVRCVSLKIVSRTIGSGHDTPTVWGLSAVGTTAEAYDTEHNCGGIADTHDEHSTTSGWYRIVTDTVSYVASGQLYANATNPVYHPVRQLGGNPAYVTWVTSTALGVSPGARAFSSGPHVDLAVAPATVEIDANWVIEGADQCFAPKIALPQGGNYLLQSAYPDEPFCETAGLVANGQQMKVFPAPADGTPLLQPIVTDVTTAVSQTTMPARFIGSDSYRLEYCVPLGLDVRIHDDSGRLTGSATAAQTALWMDDDGGCPNGFSRPNRSTRTALSSSGSIAYSINGSSNGTGPTRTIDAAGNVSGPNVVDLQVVCFTLSVSDASITTAGNCPGGAANRFVRGSQVQLQADSADHFDGWNNVDAQQGESAWVIISADRSVGANIHNDKWYEKMGNALSSVAQRALAAVVTIATGIMLAELVLVKATGLILSGVATVLHYAGVDGAAVDGIDKAGKVVGAQFTLVSLLGSCMGSVATGGTAPLLTVPVSTTAVPSGTSTDDYVATAQIALAQELAKHGVTAALPLGDLLGKPGVIANIFGGGPSSYSTDAATSWSNYGSSLGQCAQTGMNTYADTTFRGY